MVYLTSNHTRVPKRVNINNTFISVAPLITRQDNDKLAILDIFPHYPTSDPKPLGSHWVLTNGEYHEVPNGTSEEIQTALDLNLQQERDEYLDNLSCTPLQGELALIQSDLWNSYSSLVESMRPTMTPTQLALLNKSHVWKFRDPVLQFFAQSMELTEQQVVDLIELAKTI